jgi:zinc transport system substrate-binding protein
VTVVSVSLRCLTAAAALAWLACSPRSGELQTEAADASPLSVYVVNYPLQYIAERIGGAKVNVVFPTPPDVDPAFWSADSEAIGAYQQADLVLLNGAGYASWVGRASLPRARLVDTGRSFEDQLIPLAGTVTHSHGPKNEHSHGQAATTTWLDPALALAQAEAVAEAFARARPADEPTFRAGLAGLAADLRALDERLGAAVRQLGAQPLLFSHPVYQYLERRYALNGRSLHWEPDQVPSEKEWRALATLLEEHPALAMIWEAEPLPETRRKLRELGVEVAIYAPCANVPARGDWLSTMNANATAFEALTDDFAS